MQLHVICEVADKFLYDITRDVMCVYCTMVAIEVMHTEAEWYQCKAKVISTFDVTSQLILELQRELILK